MRTTADLATERALWGQGVEFVAGIDEVGRGPLAGPVAAGAVILPPISRITGKFRWLKRVNDSKQLPAPVREELSGYIWNHALAAGVGFVSVDDDRPHRHRGGVTAGVAWRDSRARREAGAPVARRLSPARVSPAADADHRRRRGSRCRSPAPRSSRRSRATGGWPSSTPSTRVTASSRTRATPRREHFAALDRLGPCRLHRRSFSPVREMVTPRLPL